MSGKNFVTYYVTGEGPLWKVFWLYGVIGSWALFGLFYLGLQTVGINWGLFLVSAIVMLPYTAWILTSVWMCAHNVRNLAWGDAARFVTFIWALNIGLVGGWLVSRLVVAPI